MSNRFKLTCTKLPAPTLEAALKTYEKAAKIDPSIAVPTHLNRRQLRSMRRRVSLISTIHTHAPEYKQ